MQQDVLLTLDPAAPTSPTPSACSATRWSSARRSIRSRSRRTCAAPSAAPSPPSAPPVPPRPGEPPLPAAGQPGRGRGPGARACRGPGRAGPARGGVPHGARPATSATPPTRPARAVERGETVAAMGGDGLLRPLAGVLARHRRARWRSSPAGAATTTPACSGSPPIPPRRPAWRWRATSACSTWRRSTARPIWASPASASTPTPTGSPTRRAGARKPRVRVRRAAGARGVEARDASPSTVDGERHELTGYSVAVANSKAYGGGMYVAPQAELDDGLLDVVANGDGVQAARSCARCRRSSRARTSRTRASTPARRGDRGRRPTAPSRSTPTATRSAPPRRRSRVRPRCLRVIAPRERACWRPWRARCARSRAASGRGGGTTLPGPAAAPRRPRRAGADGARAWTHGAVLVSATNGKTTTAAMVAAILERVGRAAWCTTAPARTWAGAWPPRCSTRAASPARSACSRWTRRGCRGWRTPCEPRTFLLSNLFRDQLDRYGELELLADALGRAGRPARRAGRALRAERRRPAGGRPRPRARGRRLLRGVGRLARRCRSSSTRPTPSTAATAARPTSTRPCTWATSAATAAPTAAGSARARAVGRRERVQLDGHARRRRDAGHARRAASSCASPSPASTTSTTPWPRPRWRSSSARSLETVRDALEGFGGAFGRVETIPVDGPAGVDPAGEEPRRRQRGAAHADARGRRARPVAGAERQDRRRPRRVVDLGRRLRAAGRPGAPRHLLGHPRRGDGAAAEVRGDRRRARRWTATWRRRSTPRSAGRANGGPLFALPTYTALLELRDLLARRGLARRWADDVARHVFGYGSLVLDGDRGPLATLPGHRRVWGVATDNVRTSPATRSTCAASTARGPTSTWPSWTSSPTAAAEVNGTSRPVTGGRARACSTGASATTIGST